MNHAPGAGPDRWLDLLTSSPARYHGTTETPESMLHSYEKVSYYSYSTVAIFVGLSFIHEMCT